MSPSQEQQKIRAWVDAYFSKKSTAPKPDMVVKAINKKYRQGLVDASDVKGKNPRDIAQAIIDKLKLQPPT